MHIGRNDHCRHRGKDKTGSAKGTISGDKGGSTFVFVENFGDKHCAARQTGAAAGAQNKKIERNNERISDIQKHQCGQNNQENGIGDAQDVTDLKSRIHRHRDERSQKRATGQVRKHRRGVRDAHTQINRHRFNNNAYLSEETRHHHIGHK
ncbi:hypothetical protein D3C72_1364910 [compost metagenome]